MRTQISGAGRSLTGEGVEPQEPLQEPNPLLGMGALSADLIALLGVECFVVQDPKLPADVKLTPVGPQVSGSGAQVPPVAPAATTQRQDFWDEVAALSNSGVVLAPNAFGAKPDLVAYAIATVSARYTLAEPRPGSPPIAPASTMTTARATTSSPTGGAPSTATLDGWANLEQCDLATVLESLLEFEHAAVPPEVRALDPVAFELARQRAADAVVAANVIRDSAMKATQGSRG